MYITKSNYTTAKQCMKKLWLKKFEPNLEEVSQGVAVRFETGNLVGECAQKLFPNGTLVEFNNNIQIMADKTKELLEAGVEVIYEAAFVHKNLIAICDILVVTNEGYEIYEVKSATDVKETYFDDVSFQCYVLRKSGCKISKASIVHIDNSYIRGKALEINKLFRKVDITEKALENYESVDNFVQEISDKLAGEVPNIGLGQHCSKPYKCGFSGHCWAHLPEYSVFDLYRVGKKSFEYYKNGIITFDDLKAKNIALKGIQKLQLEANTIGKELINKAGIGQFLKELKYPLYFLDFETFQEAIPSYEGSKPFEQIPFQYSLHYMETESGELKHKEFLGEAGVNPQKALAEQLCKDIGTNGTVLAYNMSFEGTIIAKLSEIFPSLQKHLLAIKNNLADLIIPFRSGHYYTNAMKGSFSIKSVLPALFPEDTKLNYKSLKIKNGSEAMDAYPRMKNMSEEERNETKKALLEYCKLDTFAMVKILEKLQEVTIMKNNTKKAVGKSFDEMFGDAQEFIPDPKDIHESEFEVLDEVDAGGEADLEEIDITGIKPALGKSGALNGVFPEKGVQILITGGPQDGDCIDAASYLREKFADEDSDVRIYYLGTYIDHDDDYTQYERMLFCNLPDEVSEFDNFFKSHFWEQLIEELGNEYSIAYTGYINTPQEPEDLHLTEAELDDYYEALESQQVDKKN